MSLGQLFIPRRSPLLLLHGDGANGSTAITDSSDYKRAATVNGNAQISTAQSKFGGSSMLFDGAGDFISFGASGEPWDFADKDFTIDGWVYCTSVGDHRGVISNRNFGGSVGGILIEIDDSGGGNRRFRMAGSFTDSSFFSVYASGANIAANTWYHVAVCRRLVAGVSTFTLYVNGANVGSLISAKTLRAGSGGLVVGRLYTDSDNFYFPGYLEEFRVTNAAEYSGAFTPPAEPYSI